MPTRERERGSRTAALRRRCASLWRHATGQEPPRRWRQLLKTLPVQFQRVRGVYCLALVLLPAAVIVFVYRTFEAPDKCTQQGFRCGVAGGVAGIALAATVGLAGFVLLGEHLRRQYLKRAGKEPQKLFPAAVHNLPKGEPVQTVEDLFRTIAPSWRGGSFMQSWLIRISSLLWQAESIPPQLVVGQAGEGKTTLLLQLTERLARERFIPVPVSMRDVSDFSSFLDLARTAFEATVDEQLASNDEGDRVWRWICWSGRLVVLADDLQLLAGAARARLPHAFLEAEQRNYALVVASRSDEVGSALEQWRVPLAQLSALQAREQVGPRDTFEAKRVSSLITTGQLNESRYYLAVLKRLIEKDAFPASEPALRTRLQVRRWLLESYVDAFSARRLAPEDSVETSERTETLNYLQLQCYEALVAGREPIVQSAQDGVASAMTAGLLRPLVGEEAQIEHALLQSFLASRALADTDRWQKLVRKKAGIPEARDALLFYAGVSARHDEATKIVAELLERATRRVEARISTVLLAADITIAAELIDQRDVVEAIGLVWSQAGSLERWGLVERLGRLDPEEAIKLLWRRSDDPSYRVSWSAGCALVGEPCPSRSNRRQRAEHAAAILKPDFERVIAAGERFRDDIDAGRRKKLDDDWEPEIRPLKRLGWILPVLTVGSDDPDLPTYLQRVLKVFGLGGGETSDGITAQRGPEASIAQGFKAAARLAAWELSPEVPSARTIADLLHQLLELHARARFWYARLVLLQGVTDLVIAVRLGVLSQSSDPEERHDLTGEVSRARAMIEELAERQRCPTARPDARGPHPPTHEHPFVVETASLCDAALWRVEEALEDPDVDPKKLRMIREQFIWDDEGVAVSTPSGTLDPRALRLLGDVAVLLNLNEKGHDGTRGSSDVELRKQFGVNDYLPACLGEAKARNRIVSGECKSDCLFERCPYPERAQRAHREMSKLFCRHVQQQARGVGSPPWQKQLKGLAYRRFWLRMERKAKYGG